MPPGLTKLRRVVPAMLLAACHSLAWAGDGCIDVEVDGYRALSLDCLNALLQPSQAPLPNLSDASPAVPPPNRLGLYTRAATAIQLGRNFGKSAFPERPPRNTGYSPLLQNR